MTPVETPTPTPTPSPTPTSTSTPRPNGLQLYFIDVGQGDAILVRAGSGESLLVDGGRSRARLRERLAALGISDLDAILATHPDADHIAGLIEAFDMFNVERFYWNGQAADTQTFRDLMAAAQREGSVVTTPRRGDTIPLGGLDLRVLHPATLTGDSNADSIVLLVGCGAVEVLLTGDAETPSEGDMLAAGVLLDVDILKVGHHGSRTATSDAFLATTQPEVGIISAGIDNQYGHPHQEVVDRLTAAGVQLFYTDTTDQDDTVRLTSDCQSYNLGPVTAPAATPTPTSAPQPAATPTPTAGAQAPRAPSIGDVVINEVAPNPSSGDEWVEMYNVSAGPLDVGGLWVDDVESGGGAPRQIPRGTVLQPAAYYVLELGAAYLNNSGDHARLLAADQSTVLDSIQFGATDRDVSRCRKPDGGSWSAACSPTKGTPNQGS